MRLLNNLNLDRKIVASCTDVVEVCYMRIPRKISILIIYFRIAVIIYNEACSIEFQPFAGRPVHIVVHQCIIVLFLIIFSSSINNEEVKFCPL